MFGTNSFKTLAVSAVIALGLGTMGQAAVMTCSTGSGGPGATFHLGDATMAACFPGVNDTNTIDSTFSLFGKTGWVLSDKNDGPDGDGLIEFLTAPVNGSKSGSWSLDTLAGLTDIVITLKAGNGFAAFLLDLTVATPLDGTWSSTKDLSHASIYYNGTPTMPPIPVPAAGFLLLGALGGLAALRRRKTA